MPKVDKQISLRSHSQNPDFGPTRYDPRDDPSTKWRYVHVCGKCNGRVILDQKSAPFLHEELFHRCGGSVTYRQRERIEKSTFDEAQK